MATYELNETTVVSGTPEQVKETAKSLGVGKSKIKEKPQTTPDQFVSKVDGVLKKQKSVFGSWKNLAKLVYEIHEEDPKNFQKCVEQTYNKLAKEKGKWNIARTNINHYLKSLHGVKLSYKETRAPKSISEIKLVKLEKGEAKVKESNGERFTRVHKSMYAFMNDIAGNEKGELKQKGYNEATYLQATETLCYAVDIVSELHNTFGAKAMTEGSIKMLREKAQAILDLYAEIEKKAA